MSAYTTLSSTGMYEYIYTSVYEYIFMSTFLLHNTDLLVSNNNFLKKTNKEINIQDSTTKSTKMLHKRSKITRQSALQKHELYLSLNDIQLTRNPIIRHIYVCSKLKNSLYVRVHIYECIRVYTSIYL